MYDIYSSRDLWLSEVSGLNSKVWFFLNTEASLEKDPKKPNISPPEIHAPEPLWIWAHLSRVYLMATVSSQKRFNTWRGSLVDALLCICSPILKPFVLIHSSRIPSKYRRITTKHFFLIITGFFFFFFFFFYLLFRWYMNSYTHLLLLQLDMLVIKKRERKKNRNKKLY